VLGHGLLGAMAAAAGTGEPSLQAVGVLGPDCHCRLPGAMAAAAGMADSSYGKLEP
jgi:hypothetical protein